MNLHISQQDGIPIYQQIINQIKHLIRSERLSADQELLPIRVLAQQLVINPNTVARAYRELQAQGWVYKKPGAGTFVSNQTSPLSEALCEQQITERVQTLLAEAEHMQYPTKKIIALINTLSRKNSEE